MSTHAKPKKYLQSFKQSYITEFPVLKKSRKSENHAFCTVCTVDFSVAHSGRGDVVNHIRSKKHVANVAANSQQNNKINTYFDGNKNNDLKVIRAECHMTAFLVEHNIPLSCADHVGPLLRKIFPTDEVAKSYGCARTKTTAIVGEFAMDAKSRLVASLKMHPFCIATDGSNDSDCKLYPIIVTYFNSETRVIENSLLAIPALKEASTGVNIGNLLLENLSRLNIPIKNCIGLVADNAPVMIGKKSGVAAILKNHQSNLMVIGCPCHLMNLAAETGAAFLPLNVDELLVDIFYYLQKSSKRKEKLKSFQQLHNTETKKILKHVCTRWLSLGKCLVRLLSQWGPLSFFKGEISNSKCFHSSLDSYCIPKKKALNPPEVEEETANKSAQKKRSAAEAGFSSMAKSKAPRVNDASNLKLLSREERLFYLLSCDSKKAYCLFLSYIIPHFDKVNCLLQSRTPLIHRLRLILLDFFKLVLSKFVSPAIVNKEVDILNVNYHSLKNQKKDSDILIGEETSIIVHTLKSDEKDVFYKSIRLFYVKACDYMIHKFPFKEEILLHAEVCNWNGFENASFSSIKFFIGKFPVLLEACGSSIDELQSQFCSLQMTNLSLDILNEANDDAQWVSVGAIQNEFKEFPFKKIASVFLYILSLPHSNAECERMFSQVKEIRTEFRSSLCNESLENLLIMKCNLKKKCYEEDFSDTFLRKAKSCTYVKNHK